MALPKILMSRVGYVTAQLAEMLSGYELGDRIPNVEGLTAQLHCGKGTVQAAFAALEQAGALALRSRGHLGTFIDAIDHPLLWELAGHRTVTIAMPLPYSRRYEGLATGLHATFRDHSIPMSLMFMRGSVERVGALREDRTDLVVLSALAASYEPDVEVVHDFGPETYVHSHCVIVSEGRDPQDPTLRVAVDRSSADLLALVEQVFGELPPERLVEVSYNQLDHAFHSGAIDATVWNADEVRAHITAPIDVHPLPQAAGIDNTRAVVVRMRKEQPVAVGVREALTDPAVTAIAAGVVDGRTTPTY
ncbi:GntR family transcriptional regulator YhfZ [Georgenia wangjunii]|uniref:GntR family transcriptional regulator YhfZ n=1 Tax=Georgenia wangjunii TaxID=3117730 RepID=UPI002F266893